MKRQNMHTTGGQGSDTQRAKVPSWPRIKSRKLPSGNTQYFIDAVLNGKRHYECFSTFKEAVNGAKKLNKDREAMGKAAFELTNTQRVAAVKALELLEPYPDADLVTAVQYYIDAKLKFDSAPTIANAVETLVEAKRQAGRSDKTVIDYDSIWGSFAAMYGTKKFSEIIGDDVSKWVHDGEAVSATTKAKRLNFAKMLFDAAIRKGWCDTNPARTTEKIKADARPAAPLSVAEVKKLMTHAETHGMTGLAVVALFVTGSRISEILRMEWSQFNLADKSLRVFAGQSKTRRARVVEINETGLEWLKQCAKKSGPVCDSVNFRRRFYSWRKDAGLLNGWQENHLRDTFASMHATQYQDLPKLAYMMNNSPEMIRDKYLGAVTRADAEAYWKLRPDTADNVIPLVVNQ